MLRCKGSNFTFIFFPTHAQHVYFLSRQIMVLHVTGPGKMDFCWFDIASRQMRVERRKCIDQRNIIV